MEIMAVDTTDLLRQRDAEVEWINNSVDLTPEAKQRRVAEVRDQANFQYVEARENEKRQIEQRLASATKSVFDMPTGPTYTDAAKIAQIHGAFRSAWNEVLSATEVDPADPAGARDNLKALLSQAERTGDSLLARAAYHRALDVGDGEVIDTYLETRPKDATKYEKYVEASQAAEQAKDIGSMLSAALTDRAFAS
jgi:hypothetical protein